MFHSSSLRCSPQTARIWTPWIMLFRALFSNKSTITENLVLSISWNRPLWKNGTSCRSASLAIVRIIWQLALMYFQVHVRHYECRYSAVTCNCAVAVREGNDILGIQACDRTKPPTPIRYLRDPNTPDGRADIKQLSSNSYKVGAFLFKITILLISSCFHWTTYYWLWFS